MDSNRSVDQVDLQSDGRDFATLTRPNSKLYSYFFKAMSYKNLPNQMDLSLPIKLDSIKVQISKLITSL